jgi:hypothetical protein
MRALRLSVLSAVLITLLLSLAVGAALVWALPAQVASITIDGHRLAFDHLHAGHWLVASAGLFVVLLVLLVVLPLTLLMVLIVPLSVACALALPALLAAGLVVALLVWPLVCLLRWLRR